METINKVLGFREDGLRGLHFYIKGLDYPIVVAEYSERDALAIHILEQNVRSGQMNSEQICQWCINHQIYFSFLYGYRISHFLADPLKMWRYLQMRVRLLQYSAPYSSPAGAILYL